MKTQTNIQILVLTAALAACGDSDKKADIPEVDQSRLQTESEPIPVDTTNAGQISTDPNGQSRAQLTGLLEDLLALTPTLTVVGSLASPSVGGVTLQANDITVSGSKVYMAYNTAGDQLSGGIDVIDIATPNSPVIASQNIYPTMDINKVTVNGSNLFAVGARSDTTEGAVLTKIGLDGQGKIASTLGSVL